MKKDREIDLLESQLEQYRGLVDEKNREIQDLCEEIDNLNADVRLLERKLSQLSFRGV